jgi:hypothetical protein
MVERMCAKTQAAILFLLYIVLQIINIPKILKEKMAKPKLELCHLNLHNYGILQVDRQTSAI